MIQLFRISDINNHAVEDVVPSPSGDDDSVALINKPAADCQLISEGRTLPQLCGDRVCRGCPTD